MTSHLKSGTGKAEIIGACTSIAGAAVISLVFGLLGYVAIEVTHATGRIAAFWIANAFVVGMVYGRGARCKIAALGFCFASGVAANLAVGDDPAVALMLAAANIFEIAFALWALEKFVDRATLFENARQFGSMLLIGVAAPAVSGIGAASMLLAWEGQEWWFSYGRWMSGHALAIAIFSSLILIVREALEFPEIERHKYPLTNWIYTLLVSLVVLLLIFAQNTYPILFLSAPVVVLAAFLTGRLGTALVVFLTALVAAVASFNGFGPIALVAGGPRDEIIAFQTFLGSCLAIGLPVAMVLSNRSAMGRDLQESRDFQGSILEGISDLVFRVDKDWKFTYLNPRWESAVGYSPESLIGETPFTRLMDPGTFDLRSDKETIEAGKPADEQYIAEIRTASGEVRQISVRLTPQFDDSGQFCGAIGTGTDVTEKIAHDHALEASEARFRKLAEASPVGIFQANAEGQITYVNSAWLKGFGLKQSDILGDKWKESLATGVQFEEDPAFTGFHEPGDVRRRVIRYRNAVGEDSWIETVNAAEFNAEGKITGFVGVAHDITQLVETTQSLAERESQLALLADNVTDTVLRLDLDGVCKYASPSSKQLFGIDHNLMIGNNFITGFHHEDVAAVEAEFEALSCGAIESARIAFRSEKILEPGTYQWLEANCALVRDPASGDPLEIVASLRNIDEMKLLEYALTDAKQRAEAATQAKSAFLANMSHEIRTPMNGVIGFTELSLAGEIDEDLRQNLEMIAESGRSMLRLLNDLLDFAKIESGQMSIAGEPIDIRHKIAGAVRLMEPVALQKGLTLEFACDADVPHWCRSDPMRLRQILLNLVGNALKFTEKGVVSLKVQTDREAKCIKIAVSDTGPGIAADKLAHVFEEFTQADDSIARRYGGTGLGLPISAKLAELLGGSLSVESEEGTGSTFTLEIPLRECEPPAQSETPDQVGQREARVPELLVLVAEDNPINQLLTTKMLEKAGYRTLLAENGKVAMETVLATRGSTDPIGVVLMDMQMPEMDGLEATRQIRAAGIDAEELPIISLTANAYQDDVDACRSAGMQAHLSKPVRLRDLERVLEDIASRTRLFEKAIREPSAR